MWTNLPFDVLSKIFSYLTPDSLAIAKTTCRNWHTSAGFVVASTSLNRPQPWFLAFPTRTRINSCYAHNPITKKWHIIPLNQITTSLKPITTINGLILSNLTPTTSFQLTLLNPFTKQFKILPKLNIPRTNPAVGIIKLEHNFGFKIYVAGGYGGAMYQTSIEMYESSSETWTIIEQMPYEFAVRLTVWSPNESVYSKGVLYWMTCARVYCVMGFEIGGNKWREFSVPLGDKLEFAALVLRNGNLTLFGGVCGGNLCIWELGEYDIWSVVGEVTIWFGIGGLNWGSVKCVEIDEVICLYGDIGFGFGFVVFYEGEWNWVEGFCPIGEEKIYNLGIKGLLLYPNLIHSI